MILEFKHLGATSWQAAEPGAEINMESLVGSAAPGSRGRLSCTLEEVTAMPPLSLILSLQFLTMDFCLFSHTSTNRREPNAALILNTLETITENKRILKEMKYQ